MPLYEVTNESINPIKQTQFDVAGIRERGDLQRLLKKQIEVVLKEILVIAEEFGEWEDSRRRIDLLAIDKKANLVVIELKRTEDGGHMELQALRYAAMVSTLTFDAVVDIFQRFLGNEGRDSVDAKAELEEFLGWAPSADEFGQDVKIVLVSSNFSKELTGAVLWLNQRGLDIRCIRLVPYQESERILIDVQPIIPLPEAEDYQIRIKQKEQQVRVERSGNAAMRKFWDGLLAAGRQHDQALHDRFSMSTAHRSYIGASTGVRGLTIYYVANQYDRRVELYIDRKDPAVNKDLFAKIKGYKEEIEGRFGAPLTWEELPDRQACRIHYPLPTDEFRGDETTWAEMHRAMIEAMIRFERAFGPVLPALQL